VNIHDEFSKLVRVGKRLEQHNVDAQTERKILEMNVTTNKFDAIAASEGNTVARKEMKRTVARKALHDIGMRLEKIDHIMAGARQITPAEVDAAMQLKAELYCHEVNEKRRRNKNVYKLDAKDVFTVEAAMDDLFPVHKRVRIKNDLLAAGIIS
jgi:hypothetical protein